MIDVGWISKKDLRLRGREFQRREEELRKEQSENLILEMRSGSKRQRW